MLPVSALFSFKYYNKQTSVRENHEKINKQLSGMIKMDYIYYVREKYIPSRVFGGDLYTEKKTRCQYMYIVIVIKGILFNHFTLET